MSRNVEIKQSVAGQGDMKHLLKTTYGSGELGEDHFDIKTSSKSAKNKKLRKKRELLGQPSIVKNRSHI